MLLPVKRFRSWLSPEVPVKRWGITFGGQVEDFGADWPVGWIIAYDLLILIGLVLAWLWRH
jgi:hypothetical protein